MTPTKSCPVVLRHGEGWEILAFRHPIAGLQLVKGTIEPGETPREAALRELAEEAGVQSAGIACDLGIWKSGYQKQIWSFHLCRIEEGSPDEWVHHTSDDGGHDFRFFWHPLVAPTSSEWHPVFQRALTFIRTALSSMSNDLARVGC